MSNTGLAPTMRRSVLHPPEPLNLSGSLCALGTPFRGVDDALDLDAFERLVRYQLEGGTRGLIVAGSTGEAAALESAEFSALIECAARVVADQVPLLAGTGQQSTRKTIAQTRLAAAAGAKAALVVTPPYVRATQEGLYRHFMQVAEQGGLPVVLYNVPSRSACDLLPETVARLAGHPAIVGIKEARPEAERMQALLDLRSPTFRILSGDDSTCARAILAGADGVVSVAANVAPRAMQDLCELAAAGGGDAANSASRALDPLFDLLGVEPNPIPLKWMLNRLGFGSAQLRLPLVALSTTYHARVDAVLRELALDVNNGESRSGAIASTLET